MFNIQLIDLVIQHGANDLEVRIEARLGHVQIQELGVYGHVLQVERGHTGHGAARRYYVCKGERGRFIRVRLV